MSVCRLLLSESWSTGNAIRVFQLATDYLIAGDAGDRRRQRLVARRKRICSLLFSLKVKKPAIKSIYSIFESKES